MNKLILNIPHSSTNVPNLKGYHITKNQIAKEIFKVTDWYTDELFFSKDDHMIIADFSRIYCDVERFLEDKLEVMSLFGMGVLYTKNDDGLNIRNFNDKIKDKIIKEFYNKHHEALINAIEEELKKSNKALIIDCHSFPNTPLKRDIDQNPNRPDICIGTDNFHTPKFLIDFTQKYFSNLGYSVLLNSPYSGSIVPMKFYQKNKNILSIMIELNQNLYLKEGTNEKSESYNKTRNHIENFLKEINTKKLLVNC